VYPNSEIHKYLKLSERAMQMKKFMLAMITGLFIFNIAAAKETTILVLIDSQTGGTLNLAKLLAEGIQTQADTRAIIKRVPEVMKGSGMSAEVAMLPVATIDELPTYDGIAWGSPVYFSNISANMKAFIDGTLALWTKRSLDGMPTSVFISAGSGAGKENALSSFIHTLASHGMIIVTNGMMGTEHLDKTIPQGNTTLGITTLTSLAGTHPTHGESTIAKLQGAKLAKVAAALKGTYQPTSATATITTPEISKTEMRLKKLGIVLPPLPNPVGNYKLYTISNKQVYINQVALRDGVIFNPGVLGKNATEEQAKLATEQTMLNILAILKEAAGGNLDNVKQAVQLTGYFNTVPEYSQHATILNVASDLLVKVFESQGKHARAAIGSSSLPLNSVVELQAIFELN
jgi:NAD(P)H dehydrogenase (quinone)